MATETRTEQQVRLVLEQQCSEIAVFLKPKMPAGVGFILFLADHGERGNLAYVSTIERQSAIDTIYGWLDHQDANADRQTLQELLVTAGEVVIAIANASGFEGDIGDHEAFMGHIKRLREDATTPRKGGDANALRADSGQQVASGADSTSAPPERECPFCEGRGSTDGHPCGVCNGTGRVDLSSRHLALLRGEPDPFKENRELKAEVERLRVRDSNLTFHDRNVMAINDSLRERLATAERQRDQITELGRELITAAELGAIGLSFVSCDADCECIVCAFREALGRRAPTGVETLCTCATIQRADPLRHFRECPLRKPLPPDHPQAESARSNAGVERREAWTALQTMRERAEQAEAESAKLRTELTEVESTLEKSEAYNAGYRERAEAAEERLATLQRERFALLVKIASARQILVDVRRGLSAEPAFFEAILEALKKTLGAEDASLSGDPSDV